MITIMITIIITIISKLITITSNDYNLAAWSQDGGKKKKIRNLGRRVIFLFSRIGCRYYAHKLQSPISQIYTPIDVFFHFGRLLSLSMSVCV